MGDRSPGGGREGRNGNGSGSEGEGEGKGEKEWMVGGRKGGTRWESGRECLAGLVSGSLIEAGARRARRQGRYTTSSSRRSHGRQERVYVHTEPLTHGRGCGRGREGGTGVGLNTQRSALGSPYQAMGLVVAGNCREREKSSRAVVLYRGMERKSAWLVWEVNSISFEYR